MKILFRFMRQVFLKPSRGKPSVCLPHDLAVFFYFFGQRFTTKFPNKLGFMIGPRDLNHNSVELVNRVTSGYTTSSSLPQTQLSSELPQQLSFCSDFIGLWPMASMNLTDEPRRGVMRRDGRVVAT